MNITYKILWIDDSDDFIESTIELIKETISKNYMDSDIKTYNGFEEFKKNELDNFNSEVFNLYDQILVDYALSGSTGDKIIKEIRDKSIYTDIIFYSSNYENMLQDIQNKEQLNGVFFTRREDLISTVNNVIKKNLKREYCIPNIRGIIMDGTSEFDFICRNVSLTLYYKLQQEDKTEVLNAARKYFKKAEDKANKNFEKLTNTDKKDGDEFFKKILCDVFYVMDNKDRYELLSLIVRKFDFEHKFNSTFAQDYYDNLIQPRNELAHNKLYYGDCKKKIHIAKDGSTGACNKECKTCTSKYDVSRCEKIREHIYKYYLILNKLYDNVVNLHRTTDS